MSNKIILFGIICGGIGAIGIFVIIGILIANHFGIMQVCVYTCILLMGFGYIACEIGSSRKFWEE